MFTLNFFILQIIGYLCGSIPFGLIISKTVKNVDIREHGSKSIGATNSARVLGKKWGALVLLLDGLKAAIPLAIAKYYLGIPQEILAFTTCSIVIGHIFPIWLNFKGGKGIACILFSYFVLDWRLGTIFISAWIIIFILSKISALSALGADIIATVFSYFISMPYFIMSLFLGALVFYRHKENIGRITRGEELGFGKK